MSCFFRISAAAISERLLTFSGLSRFTSSSSPSWSCSAKTSDAFCEDFRFPWWCGAACPECSLCPEWMCISTFFPGFISRSSSNMSIRLGS